MSSWSYWARCRSCGFVGYRFATGLCGECMYLEDQVDDDDVPVGPPA